MNNLVTKTRILNKVRSIGKIPVIENLLTRISANKRPENFLSRIIPNNYQYPQNSWRECTRNGISYRLDISDYMQHCIYFGLVIEPRDVLYGLVKDGTTVIDVGTNIGETLLNFAQINPHGQNIGFEPVPQLFQNASNNLQLNPFRNIRLENLALSNTPAKLSFVMENELNSGGIFLTSASRKTNGSTVVKSVTLDSYAEATNLKDVALIKIDVEGFEMNVLKGATQVIKQHRPTLFVELDDQFLSRQGSSAKELVSFLASFDYQITDASTGNSVSAEDNFAGKHFDIVCVCKS